MTGTISLAPLALTLVAPVSLAAAQSLTPGFSKAFAPATIGAGSMSTLTFTIANTGGGATPVTTLAFTDTLPAGMVIATPGSAATTCTDGIVSAPDGGTTIGLTGGRLGAGETCTVTVNVTATVTGTNRSGALTSSAGNGGTATATLTVDADRPGFSKSFAPSTITLGQVSVLTFTINKPGDNGNASSLSFLDVLPAGMVIATPPNASTTCSGTVTAVVGTSTISLASGFVAQLSSCTVTVRVTTSTAGTFVNTTGELTSIPAHLGVPASSGKATAALEVTEDAFRKIFTDDPVAPGGTVTLEFTVRNLDRTNPASNISFTDDLDGAAAALAGVVATGLPVNDVCGAGSVLAGTDVVTLTGGTLGPEASGTFSVTLQLPTTTAAGTHLNTTSTVSTSLGPLPAASDSVVVSPFPLLTKSFIDDPTVPGGTVTLRFTITNTSPASDATAITFEDDFVPELPTAVSTPGAGFCNGTGTATYTPLVNLMPPGGGGGTTPASLGDHGRDAGRRRVLQLRRGAQCGPWGGSWRLPQHDQSDHRHGRRRDADG